MTPSFIYIDSTHRGRLHCVEVVVVDDTRDLEKDNLDIHHKPDHHRSNELRPLYCHNIPLHLS